MENKKILIGGLAIVGAIALFAYLKPKNKKNSEGFFNAGGRRGMYAQCVNSSGNYYGTKGTGICRGGDRGTVRYAKSKNHKSKK